MKEPTDKRAIEKLMFCAFARQKDLMVCVVLKFTSEVSPLQASEVINFNPELLTRGPLVLWLAEVHLRGRQLSFSTAPLNS